MLKSLSNIYIYIYRLAKTIPVFLFLVLISACSVIFNSSFVFAEPIDYNVNIQDSLSVVVSSDTVNLNLNPLNQTYGTSNLDITVGTNYLNGYKLYINSASSSLANTDYYNNTGIATSPSITPGTAPIFYIDTLESSTTASAFPVNYWGYRISSGNTGDPSITDTSTESSTTSYYPFSSGTLVSSASAPTSSNTSTLTFASKIDYDKPAGSYKNTFTFSAIINPVTYAITYADNTGDSTVSNLPTPNPATGIISGTSATISSTIPTRTNYTFKSWCLGTPTNSSSTCDGTEYAAGSTIDFSTYDTVDVPLTLYAIWDFASTTMQGFTASMCASQASSSPVTLLDIRDNQ